jgi:hypothetical protein
MEVHFTPEQEVRLAQIATKAGTAPGFEASVHFFFFDKLPAFGRR